MKAKRQCEAAGTKQCHFVVEYAETTANNRQQVVGEPLGERALNGFHSWKSRDRHRRPTRDCWRGIPHPPEKIFLTQFLAFGKSKCDWSAFWDPPRRHPPQSNNSLETPPALARALHPKTRRSCGTIAGVMQFLRDSSQKALSRIINETIRPSFQPPLPPFERCFVGRAQMQPSQPHCIRQYGHQPWRFETSGKSKCACRQSFAFGLLFFLGLSLKCPQEA